MPEEEADSRIAELEGRIRALEASMIALRDAMERNRVQLMDAVDRTIGDARSFNRPKEPWQGSLVPTSPEGFPYLGRNMKLHFADTAGTAVFLSAGWWDPEDWGVWGRNNRHVLRFAINASYHGGFLDVVLEFKYILAPGMHWPTVSVSANGFHLGSMTGRKQPWFIRLRLPPSCIDNGNILLALNYDSPVLAGAINGDGDGRRIGLGLISMEVL